MIRYDDSCTDRFQGSRRDLTGVDVRGERSADAPWPDAVIADRPPVRAGRPVDSRSGRINAPVLQVHLGRPRVDLGLFDLVGHHPQYNLPDAAKCD